MITNENESITLYDKRVASRNKIKFIFGYIIRLKAYLIFGFNRHVARSKGAKIGKNSVFSYALAKKANPNLTIGNNCSIQTHLIDMRASVIIGNHVIIGENVEIITVSHDIDSIEWEPKYYGIEIEDYVWIATKSIILPSCRKLGKGVCSGGSVVVRNTEEMDVVSGNVAQFLRKRKVIHNNLVGESLLGGDFKRYCRSYFKKND